MKTVIKHLYNGTIIILDMNENDSETIIESIFVNMNLSSDETIRIANEFLKLREEKQKVKEVIKTVEVASPCPYQHYYPQYGDNNGTSFPHRLGEPIWVVDFVTQPRY